MGRAVRIILAIALLSGCGEGEVVLTSDDLRLADSLFLVSRNEWTIKLEDSCNSLREVRLHEWTDSIKNQRLSEINEMLKQHGESK